MARKSYSSKMLASLAIGLSCFEYGFSIKLSSDANDAPTDGTGRQQLPRAETEGTV